MQHIPKCAIFKGKSFTRNGNTITEIGHSGGMINYSYPTVSKAKASMEYARVSGTMLPGFVK